MSLQLKTLKKKIAKLGGPIVESDPDHVRRKKGVYIIVLIALQSLDAIEFKHAHEKAAAFNHLLHAAKILERAV